MLLPQKLAAVAVLAVVLVAVVVRGCSSTGPDWAPNHCLTDVQPFNFLPNEPADFHVFQDLVAGPHLTSSANVFSWMKLSGPSDDVNDVCSKYYLSMLDLHPSARLGLTQATSYCQDFIDFTDQLANMKPRRPLPLPVNPGEPITLEWVYLAFLITDAIADPIGYLKNQHTTATADYSYTFTSGTSSEWSVWLEMSASVDIAFVSAEVTGGFSYTKSHSKEVSHSVSVSLGPGEIAAVSQHRLNIQPYLVWKYSDSGSNLNREYVAVPVSQPFQLNAPSYFVTTV